MKKNFVLVVAVLFGLLLVPRVEVKAEADSHYKDGESVFFANGAKVVITERTDGVEGAHLELSDGTSYNVPRINIYGGSNNAPVENTNIVLEGGTVKNIYGGGMLGSGTVKNVSITVKGGKVGYDISGTKQGGFIFAGGSSGASVSNAEIIVENIAMLSLQEGIVGSGDNNTNTTNSTIIVNGGSPKVAHAYGTANVGTSKIIINNHSSAQLINGYYYDFKKDNSYGYAEKFVTEVWGGSSRLMTITSGVKDKDGNVVSSSTITELSYYRGVNINPMSEIENFGSVRYDAKEIIPYIRLNVRYGDEVASELVPAGLLDANTLDTLRTRVIDEANVKDEDVSKEFYYDDAFENIYNSTDEVAKNSGNEATLYLRTLNGYTFKLVYGDIVVSRVFKEGHEITEEELTDIFAEFLAEAELTEEAFENMEFYLDEDMTEAIDTETFEIGSMNQDLTLYVNVAQHREVEGDEITENPDTADMNLVLVIGAMLAGSLGLGYTIKKRRFN